MIAVVEISSVYTLAALVVLLAGSVAAMLRMTVKIVRAIDRQLEAMRANTRAVEKLTARVDALERGVHA